MLTCLLATACQAGLRWAWGVTSLAGALTPACARRLPAGEGEAEHRELVDFCSTFRFERMGCFQYSEEDGTPAAELPEQVGGGGEGAQGRLTQRLEAGWAAGGKRWGGS